MESRIEINSKTASVDIYKQLPSADPNTKYALTVENVTVPPMTHGMVLNSPLFTIERRLKNDATLDTEQESVALDYEMTFTPRDVQTVGQLAFQMNEFLQIGFIKNLQLGLNNYDTDDHPELPRFDLLDAELQHIADHLLPELAGDWYDILINQSFTNKNLIQVVLTPSGHIGFKFSKFAQVFFVINLTDEGKRIFGWDHSHIAVDNGVAKLPYIEIQGGLKTVILPDPTNTPPTDEVIVMLEKVSQHVSYRNELVITTSLPLPMVLQSEEKKTKFKPQFVSYRYQLAPTKIQWESTYFQTRKESRQNVYQFEKSNRTHNSFLLTGTELQNFHLRLVSRNHVYNKLSNDFDIKDVPYPLPDESYWSISIKYHKIK